MAALEVRFSAIETWLCDIDRSIALVKSQDRDSDRGDPARQNMAYF
jgi:hypothetical protein